MQNVLSLVIGVLPEAVLFFLIFCFAKIIKEKRLILFFSFYAIHAIFVLVMPYLLPLYFLEPIAIFIALKLIYKKEAKIIDMFVAYIIYVLLGAFSFVSILLPTYEAAFIANRVLVISFAWALKPQLHILYNLYKRYWNKQKDTSLKVKSLDVRNASIILMNVAVILSSFIISLMK